MDKMTEETKIAAVVVTFNRKGLLLDSIEGILKQSASLDHIFIVDNASTDGTETVIQEHFGNNPLITTIRLDENTGSAGGFHHGVKAAYDWGADWIWFLDDDVTPTEHCLETMMQYKHISKCMHPSKYDIHHKEFIWEMIFDPALGKATPLPNISFKNGKDFTFVNIGCFEGMLIHRDVVAKIGFPDPRFFIAGDDTMYGFAASLYTNVIYIKDARIVKLIPFNHKISPLFMYYSVRNQFLMKEYLEKYGVFNRSMFYLYFTLFIFYALTKHTIRSRSIKIPFYVVRGLFDGMRQRFYKL
jgi:rhamnopyranosyl-N-acetylglucosaminyl-diphospho-decaprenol beta-1,3/1,4-galactofuranosyltransferase